MIATPSFEDITPRQDDAAQLLLLTASSRLDEQQIPVARSLAHGVSDWNAFIETANKKFSISTTAKTLQKSASDVVPAEVLRRLREANRQRQIATLRVMAAHLAFHKNCIQACNAAYAYMKGFALSSQFDRPVLDRYCRDIDVLVAKNDLLKLIQTAVDAGYQVLMDYEPVRFANSAQDLEFMSKFSDVITLIGPERVPIEVHSRLTKLSLEFDLDRVFREAETVTISGLQMKTLSKSMHFVFVCYHHARHFWSHLHWLADLDSMIKSGLLDTHEIAEIANGIGISPTVEAAFEFHDLFSNPNLWDKNNQFRSPGLQFLKACLINLNGGLDLEQRLRSGRALGDFMSAWQMSPGRYSAFWRHSWFVRLRPNAKQYLTRQRSPQFYWIYVLENFCILFGNAILRARYMLPGKKAPIGPPLNDPSNSPESHPK